MSETVIIKAEELFKLDDSNLVDAVLDNANFDKRPAQRVSLLYRVMGVRQVFGSSTDPGSMSPEDEYALAKEQLIVVNERRRKALGI